MRHLISGLLLMALLLLPCGALSGYGRTYEPLPARLDGSMMPYDFSLTDSLPYIPEGYRAVHVSYVARHGARYLSSYKKISKIEKHLYECALKKKLTPEGEAFFKLIRDIDAATAGRWGELSEVGIAEEKRLGRETAEMFPELLKTGKAFGVSTFVPRVIMTMYEFLHSLEMKHQKLELYTGSGRQNDSLLYCFATFQNYSDFRDSGDWEKVYDGFVDKYVSADPARRLFGSYYDNDAKKLRKLTMEIYGVLQGCRAAGLQAPTTRWMTEAEYRSCFLASNLKHFLRNTPNPLNEYCASATSMLLRRIIDDADEALREKPEANPFSGYFGHCETLLPLFAVMNLPGCFVDIAKGAESEEEAREMALKVSTYDDLYEDWQLDDISPLGANLMLVFMKEEGEEDNPGAPVFVSVRLNGANVEAYDGAGPTTEWSALKRYWEERILGLVVSG